MALVHSPRIVTDGLVFAFDAKNTKCYPGSGTTFTEMIIPGAGEFVGSPTYDAEGFFTFNGTSTGLVVPNSTNLDNQTISVEAVAKCTTTSQNGFLFEKGYVNTQYSLFHESATLKLRGHTGAGYETLAQITTATYIGTTDWYHIIATFTSGTQKIYVDGSECTLSAGGTVSGTLSTSVGGMSIGCYGGYAGSHSYWYSGDIAIVRVYNKVLSADEVRQNFEAHRGRFGL